VEPAGGAGGAPLRMRRRQDDGQGRQKHCPGNMPGEIRVADPHLFCPLRTKPFFYIKFFAKEDGRWKMEDILVFIKKWSKFGS
jgi:hypothetical protein